MAIKALGKNELKELGCNFIVVNVPVFAATNDAKETKKMETHLFESVEQVKEFVTKNTPMAVFDLTGVYGSKADKPSDKNLFAVRCCKLGFIEFENIRNNLRESESLNFMYPVDFSCWHNGKI
jgi:hypothetical protein